MTNRDFWTACRRCKNPIYSPSSDCPRCGADIDRQFASISDKELGSLMEEAEKRHARKNRSGKSLLRKLGRALVAAGEAMS